MESVRVRFAPSPTGALHIGGVRTALYNYLFAHKHQGTFILRVEDTDQARYVPKAEEYIIESLQWLGITPDEGPGFGGELGPYRQSERRALYKGYAEELVKTGNAYYAFDTPEELEARRQQEQEKGNHTFKYDASVRMEMRNSLNMSESEAKAIIQSGKPYVIRMKVPENETIQVSDLIRGDVQFDSNELDDKVILKADSMPTYHLANIIDDYLMKISHVVRGEEWLSSTAHHVLLYRFFGWQEHMPHFAHLPLILKPTGKGKLSKRDGAKLGIPVFPLAWKGETPEDSFTGFREFGFDPRAVINFLAFLGWNPGTEQELFSLEALCEAFSIERIGKAGARFDFDKAKWYNEQYLQMTDNETLAEMVRPYIEKHGHQPTADFLVAFCGLLKERVTFLPDFWEKGYYFFEPVKAYEQKPLRKKWKPERKPLFEELKSNLKGLTPYSAEALETTVKAFMATHELGFGDVLPILRVALSGTVKGPGVFEMMELLGKEEVDQRLERALLQFDELSSSQT